MRYAKPLGKLFYTGSKALLDDLLRQTLHTDKAPAHQHNEYPILLMHGFMGYKSLSLFNRQFFDYFNGAKQVLQQLGYSVYAYEVSPLDPLQDRVIEWSRHVERALKDSGAEKLHIIAHSQGAIDARVLAADTDNRCQTPHHGEIGGMGYGDKIASITSIAGPHLGTPLAEHTESKETRALITDLIDFIAMANAAQPLQVRKALDTLSRDYMVTTFNPSIRVPDMIPCYTVAANPLSEQQTSFLFDKTWQHISDIAEFDGGGANDGFVPVSSAFFEGQATALRNSNKLQWQPLGQVTTDHIGLVGLTGAGTDEPFSHVPMLVGLCQNIDTCYTQNLSLALQTDGKWRRHQHSATGSHALERSVELALQNGSKTPA
ncbi:Triacylglycerol lipase [BD1-7 clade bacterium]|uniref:Triacylglycerol lipase n=1 Tax=BD1-7 clade bacterium TaxID=2029982 RepID=A0A5S9N2B3_9GAMM|nr:Triacylglycerol lipase [BD1-7 clade bacterium]CAA0082824.1 Triacylglycerol lipase [BD1-7 clade bacterium]